MQAALGTQAEPSCLPLKFGGFKKIILFLFLATLGLHCFEGFSLVTSRDYSLVAVQGLLAVASLVSEHGL